MNKKIYLLFALIVVTISVKAQEPQCESFQVTESRCAFSATPTTLNAVFNNTDFQTTDSYRLSSSVPCPPPDEVTPPVGVTIDDGYSQIINLGFNFCYYGNTYDQIVVNDNGFITFDLSVADSHDFNTYTIPDGINTTSPTGTAVLPTPQEQTNAIYACWVDTYTPSASNPASAIQFRLINQDNPGKRIFIIDWKQIPLFGNNSEFLSASLHLYETSNVIETNIYEIGESSTNDGRAVVGLQNKSGTLGWSISDRTNGNWTATNPWIAEKWVMIPDGNVLGYEFKWYVDYGQGNGYEELFPNQDLDPLSVEVNPTTETEYKAEFKFQSECSSEQIEFRETLIIDPLNQEENVQNPVDLYLCETSFGDGTANFDIDQFDTLLTEYINSTTWDMNDFTVSYYASVDDRDNDNNPIDSSVDYNAADNTTIYVRITFDYETECLDDSEFVLHVTPLPDTTFNYDQSIYCIVDNDPTPTAITSDGEYTIDNGGVINSQTGEINILLSGAGDDGTGIFNITYSITVSTYDDDNNLLTTCPNSTEVAISIEETGITDFTYPATVCLLDNNPAPIQFNTGGVFTINNGGVIDSVTGEMDLANTPAGAYDITYEMNANGNCPSLTSQSITVYELPIANAPTTILNECNNGDGTANFNLASLEDEIIGSQNVLLSYHPTYQDAEDNTNMINIIPFARVDDNVFARVENTNGCVSIVQVPLSIENCYIVLPGGFSPNSAIADNQTFNVRNLRVKFPKFQLFIYNRFGNLVYEGDATSENWNGKLNNEGDLLPAGTYFYGIKLNDEQELTNRGWVYLQE